MSHPETPESHAATFERLVAADNLAMKSTVMVLDAVTKAMQPFGPIETREERLADVGSPTTADLAETSEALSRAMRAIKGDPDAQPPMKALLVGMTISELRTRLIRAGLECYPDCSGNTVIRTKEAGDEHRAKLKAEREARRDEQIRNARGYGKGPK